MAALVTASGLAPSEDQQVHNPPELENPLSLEAGFQRVLCPSHVPFLGLPTLLCLPGSSLTRQHSPWVGKRLRDKPLQRQFQGTLTWKWKPVS